MTRIEEAVLAEKKRLEYEQQAKLRVGSMTKLVADQLWTLPARSVKLPGFCGLTYESDPRTLVVSLHPGNGEVRISMLHPGGATALTGNQFDIALLWICEEISK